MLMSDTGTNGLKLIKTKPEAKQQNKTKQCRTKLNLTLLNIKTGNSNAVLPQT